jgi:hypothetical protein
MTWGKKFPPAVTLGMAIVNKDNNKIKGTLGEDVYLKTMSLLQPLNVPLYEGFDKNVKNIFLSVCDVKVF